MSTSGLGLLLPQTPFVEGTRSQAGLLDPCTSLEPEAPPLAGGRCWKRSSGLQAFRGPSFLQLLAGLRGVLSSHGGRFPSACTYGQLMAPGWKGDCVCLTGRGSVVHREPARGSGCADLGAVGLGPSPACGSAGAFLLWAGLLPPGQMSRGHVPPWSPVGGLSCESLAHSSLGLCCLLTPLCRDRFSVGMSGTVTLEP